MKSDPYQEAGKAWLAGKDIGTFGTDSGEIVFNAKQREFINSRARHTLFAGGRGSGKTTAFIVKAILLSLFFPGNQILMGRKTRQDLEATTLQDFFRICPKQIYSWKVKQGIIEFFNGSTIVCMGLDAIADDDGQGTRKGEQRTKGLNLGAYFLDQLEEIEQRVYDQLSTSMRRNVPFQQANSTTNPANFWALDYFKLNPVPGTKLIETSMLDNREHLSEAFIQDQLNKPDLYKRKFVYGEWSTDVLTTGAVFADEMEQIVNYKRDPVRHIGKIQVFHEPEDGHEYQIGVDPSLGAHDPSAVVVVDKMTGETAATYTALAPVEDTVARTVTLADMYHDPIVVAESDGVGAAYIQELKKQYDKIYVRERYNRRDDDTTEILGWSTNWATKSLLIEHFRSLLLSGKARIRDKAITEEFKVFVYSNQAAKKGAGAEKGFHDDLVMATMFAYWKVNPESKHENRIDQLLKRQAHPRPKVYKYR